MTPQRMYRPEEAARILRLKVSTVRKRILNGSIQVVRLSSRSARISQSELLRIQAEGFLPVKKSPGVPRVVRDGKEAAQVA